MGGYEYWDSWIGPLDALSASCTKWGFLWVLPVLFRALSNLLWKTCKDWNCSTSQSNLFCSLTGPRELSVLTDWLCWNFSPNTTPFLNFTSGLFPEKALEIHCLFALCGWKLSFVPVVAFGMLLSFCFGQLFDFQFTMGLPLCYLNIRVPQKCFSTLSPNTIFLCFVLGIEFLGVWDLNCSTNTKLPLNNSQNWDRTTCLQLDIFWFWFA